jgi:hypothetical protein
MIDNFTAVVTGSGAGFSNYSGAKLNMFFDLHHKSWRSNGVVAPVVQMHRPGDHFHKANIREHEEFPFLGLVKYPIIVKRWWLAG